MTEYEKNINSLIPAAELEASEMVASLGISSESRNGANGQPYNHCFWTEFFHKAMNRMTLERGLRS